MKDVLDELAAVRRAMGTGSVPAGEAYTIELRRRYDAEIDDVWDAVTSPERLQRWFKPVTGDLRLGGKFALDGGEHGEILRCEPPRLLKVSWLYGPDADAWPGTSEVEVRLTAGPAGGTEFELIHAAVVGEPLFPTYGPGAGGVGWDLTLLALGRLLAGSETIDHEEFEKSPEGREFGRRSAAAWGRAHLAAGGEPEHVAAAVEATTKFYVPDPT
ncbi:SRPBCC domain-containing protein [Planobispora longispora]|uniref:Activator of HSP90 ATPase n=1 Tax=Planobispora longispora TaxID=28887 RepID=A0A8J3RQY6_9ACTN|nr:SRPBCC domain-containing protein [Planobispora longispora]BFE81299.1 SRPBCC family protein [Planobispora longispora]GIH81281.1 activator of HSP90 ATPase [Planobispora longispora]